MRFFVNGFSWEASAAPRGGALPSREAALGALERVHFPGTDTRHYSEALAALSVCDYGHVIACCEAAAEAGSPERWT